MTTKPIRSEDYQKGYSAGYMAGQAKAAQPEEQPATLAMMEDRRAFKREVFLAALTGLLANSLTRASAMAQPGRFIDVSRLYADEAARIAFD